VTQGVSNCVKLAIIPNTGSCKAQQRGRRQSQSLMVLGCLARQAIASYRCTCKP
jgi:hypothetical protein